MDQTMRRIRVLQCPWRAPRSTLGRFLVAGAGAGMFCTGVIGAFSVADAVSTALPRASQVQEEQQGRRPRSEEEEHRSLRLLGFLTLQAVAGVGCGLFMLQQARKGHFDASLCRYGLHAGSGVVSFVTGAHSASQATSQWRRWHSTSGGGQAGAHM
jgi:hypothetical protein